MIMARKYDWQKLKQDFFDSNYANVEDFFKHVQGIPEARAKNGAIGRNTKGWAEEKANLREQASERAKEESLKKATEELILPTQFFLRNKKKILNIVKAKVDYHAQLVDAGKEGDVDVRELEALLKMTKTELAEPISYTEGKNYNENNNTHNIDNEELKAIQNILINKDTEDESD